MFNSVTSHPSKPHWEADMPMSAAITRGDPLRLSPLLWSPLRRQHPSHPFHGKRRPLPGSNSTKCPLYGRRLAVESRAAGSYGKLVAYKPVLQKTQMACLPPEGVT